MHIIDRVHPPIPDIWGLISQTPELSSFEKIIQSAGLISKLQEQGPFTLFAPTNNATDPRQNHRVWDRLEKRDLEYYLVEGRHRREDLSDRLFRTVSRDYVLVDVRLDGTVILNSRVQVRSFNHEASNGVIHFISERLTRPLDLVATARSEGLTSFVRALEVAGLTEAFQEEGPYTMFAWSNAAWIHLDPSQASELLNDREKMRQVVLYHIIPRYLLFDNLLEGSYLTLLQSEITVSFDYQDESDSSFRVKIDDANLSGIDIIASNGCLHRVSRVLHLR
jgi:transforming growth factor-beta-induced protein